MSLHFIDVGRLAALARFGVSVKEAEEPQAEEQEGHTLRNVAMAGAAAAPFAGMIGQKPVIHDPIQNSKIHRSNSLAEVSRMAQPGDVLITGKPSPSVWRDFIKPLSGSELYHTQPVVGRKKGHGTAITAGEFVDPSFKNYNLKQMHKDTDTVQKMLKIEDYPDSVLLRPKKKMSPAELKAFTAEAYARAKKPYDEGKAIKSWLKEIFVPKLKAFKGIPGKTVCKGDICSSLPAQAYASQGRQVVPGKAPKDVFPTDFLRSEEFEPVTSRISSKYTTSPLMRRLSPYLYRAAGGAGLAGLTYAASKDPAAASVPIGLMAGGVAADALAKHLKYKAPTLLDFASRIGDVKSKERAAMIKGLLGKRLAPMAAGAGATYAATRAIQKYLASRESAHRDTE